MLTQGNIVYVWEIELHHHHILSAQKGQLMRVLHYSHDHYGIENLQRTFAFTEQVSIEFQKATQLVISGSPQPCGVKLPRKVDYIKLPSMDQSRKNELHVPSLSLPLDVIKKFRETLLFEAIQQFKPDVVVLEAERDIQEEFYDNINNLKQDQFDAEIILRDGDQDNIAMMILQGLLDEVPDQPQSDDY